MWQAVKRKQQFVATTVMLAIFADTLCQCRDVTARVMVVVDKTKLRYPATSAELGRNGIEDRRRCRAGILRIERQAYDALRTLLIEAFERCAQRWFAVGHSEFDMHGTGYACRQLLFDRVTDVPGMREQW